MFVKYFESLDERYWGSSQHSLKNLVVILVRAINLMVAQHFFPHWLKSSTCGIITNNLIFHKAFSALFLPSTIEMSIKEINKSLCFGFFFNNLVLI